jgi:hypothetical protein
VGREFRTEPARKDKAAVAVEDVWPIALPKAVPSVKTMRRRTKWLIALVLDAVICVLAVCCAVYFCLGFWPQFD